MTNKNEFKLFQDLVFFSHRLPDLKGLYICNPPKESADLNAFLDDCVPTKLELLAVECFSDYANASFYIDSLSKAVSAVAKQVYLEHLKFTAADLQKLVRAARNAEQIVFNYCSIDLEDELDFGAKVKYNTESLSINCYNTLIKVDGDKKDFSNFSKVVDAIAKSGLNSSLTKIYIDWSNESVVAEAQRLLSVKGMKHISVNGGSIARITS